MNPSEMLPYVIVLLFLAAVIVFCLVMAVKTSKARRAGKRALQDEKNQFNAQDTLVMNHVYGLDVPEDAPCTVCICPDRFVFVRNQTSFNLPFEKVTDVSVKSDVELRENYVSSSGGALAGGMLFGPLGAAIGGRAKKKTNVSVTKYLIFSYQKGDTVDYICFLLFRDAFAKKCINAIQNQPHFQKPKSVDL